MYPSGLLFNLQPGRIALRSPPSSIPGQLRAGDEPKAFWHNAWCKIVEVYSGTNLSFPQDKLTALSGVTNYFAIKLQMHDDKYLAGLWQQDLQFQLLWSTETSRLHGQRAHRVSSYRAPSWSWAAVDGSITFETGSRRDWVRSSQSLIIVLDTQLVHQSEDSTGPTRGGYLEIRGTLGKAMIASTDTSANPKNHIQRMSQGDEEAQGLLDSNVVKFDSNFDVRLDAQDDDFSEGLENQRAINFLLVDVASPPRVQGLQSCYILLLVPVPKDMGSFRRVGMGYDY